MKISFKNPPINEVVIGAYFDPPLVAFRSEHVGLLWSKFRETFPTVEQRAPIGASIQGPVSMAAGECMPMPRYWFVSKDEAILIQVQKDAFLLNWRRRDSEYPHFESLKLNYEKYYRIFEVFLKDCIGGTSPIINGRELTYIDMIEQSDYWKGSQDTSDIIRSFSIPDWIAAHGSVQDFQCAYRFDVDPDLRMQVSIRSGDAVFSPGSPCLILEFKALSSQDCATRLDANAWYDKAHDAIVTQFLDMTTERVQRDLWKREAVE